MKTTIPRQPTALFLIALSLLLSLVTAQSPGTQSISSMSDYTSLRPCAKSCFWGGYSERARDKLGSSLKCDITTMTINFQTVGVAMNNCYCRPDLHSHAHHSLSSCIDNGCTSNSNDVFSATSVYDAYCAANGYSQGASVEATTTDAGTQEATATNRGGNGPVKTGVASGVTDGKALLGVGVLIAVLGQFYPSW